MPAWAVPDPAAAGEDAGDDAAALGLVLLGADELELELELHPAIVSTVHTAAATATALGPTKPALLWVRNFISSRLDTASDDTDGRWAVVGY